MLLQHGTPHRRAGRADWIRTCKKVGEILKKNGFPKNILLVAAKRFLRSQKDNITEHRMILHRTQQNETMI